MSKQGEEQEYLANESAKAIADNEAKIEAEHQQELGEQDGLLLTEIAELFKIARLEGALRKWADGKKDAGEALAKVKQRYEPMIRASSGVLHLISDFEQKDRPELNITAATKRACEEPTLLDALSWICVWESERVVKQARANPQWETCFKVCLQSVLDNYQQKGLDRPELREKIEGILLNVGQDFKLKVRRGSGVSRERFEKTIASTWAKHILALFIPDMESFERNVELIAQLTTMCTEKNREIEEAKKQEKDFKLSTTSEVLKSPMWQALRERIIKGIEEAFKED